MQLIVNGLERELPDDSVVLRLIEELRLAERRCAVELNGEIVPRSQHASTRLRERDRVEVVLAVGGG